MNIRFHGIIAGGTRRAGVLAAAVMLMAVVNTGCTALWAGGALLSAPLEVVVIPIGKLSEIEQRAMRRKQPPEPESVWNHPGYWNSPMWRRIGSAPASYVPRGMETATLANVRDGTWHVDTRDGKRLFVPNTGVDGLTPKDHRRRAVEITNDTKGQRVP